MDEPFIKTTDKRIYLLNITNYILLVVFSVFMYTGYLNMVSIMKAMLRNTYAMCNMTHVLTSAPAICYS